MKMNTSVQTVMCMKSLLALTLLGLTGLQAANAAVALDRTRVIFEGGQKSMSVNVRNDNTKLPDLAQSWVEDANGQKINILEILLKCILYIVL